MVSTWDVSRKQIGDAASLAARRHGWWKGTSELWTALRQSGSCFVWKWRSKKNQNIVIFPKMCLFKTEKLRKIDNIQVIEKLLRNRPQTYPNIPKQLVAPGREGFGDPGPCTSRERLVTILNLPMAVPAIDLNQLCTGIVHLLSEFSMTEKHKSPVCWDSSGKKETRVMIMIWIPIFKKYLKWFSQQSGNPCDTEKSPLALGKASTKLQRHGCGMWLPWCWTSCVSVGQLKCVQWKQGETCWWILFYKSWAEIDRKPLWQQLCWLFNVWSKLNQEPQSWGK